MAFSRSPQQISGVSLTHIAPCAQSQANLLTVECAGSIGLVVDCLNQSLCGEGDGNTMTELNWPGLNLRAEGRGGSPSDSTLLRRVMPDQPQHLPCRLPFTVSFYPLLLLIGDWL